MTVSWNFYGGMKIKQIYRQKFRKCLFLSSENKSMRSTNLIIRLNGNAPLFVKIPCDCDRGVPYFEYPGTAMRAHTTATSIFAE